MSLEASPEWTLGQLKRRAQQALGTNVELLEKRAAGAGRRGAGARMEG